MRRKQHPPAPPITDTPPTHGLAYRSTPEHAHRQTACPGWHTSTRANAGSACLCMINAATGVVECCRQSTSTPQMHSCLHGAPWRLELQQASPCLPGACCTAHLHRTRRHSTAQRCAAQLPHIPPACRHREHVGDPICALNTASPILHIARAGHVRTRSRSYLQLSPEPHRHARGLLRGTARSNGPATEQNELKLQVLNYSCPAQCGETPARAWRAQSSNRVSKFPPPPAPAHSAAQMSTPTQTHIHIHTQKHSLALETRSAYLFTQPVACRL